MYLINIFYHKRGEVISGNKSGIVVKISYFYTCIFTRVKIRFISVPENSVSH